MRLLPLKHFMCCLLLLFCVPACTHTSTPPASSGAAPTDFHPDADPASRELVEREMVRRQQATEDALGLIEEGDRMRAAGDLEGATRAYQKSLDKVP